MGLLQEVAAFCASHASLTILTVILTPLLTHITYNICLHPLSHIPGPLAAKISPLYLYYHAYKGTEGTTIANLHKKYGPILRIAPNDVIINDASVLHPIYVERGGFRKAPCYTNFDFEGHTTIFSAINAAYHASRRKPVMQIFSTGAIKADGEQHMNACAEKFVRLLEREARKGGPVDVTTLARSLAADAMTGYLFGESYGGLEEAEGGKEELSAAPFVDLFVSVGAFFLLPNRVFLFVLDLIEKLVPDRDADGALDAVEVYVRRAIKERDHYRDTYQSRLLDAGISEDETAVQMKDLMFAGIDSTATILARTCYELAKNQQAYDRLCKEVQDIAVENIHTLPYLRGVVNEALRLSLANPARLPRVVPDEGFSYKGYFLPGGAVVGCQSFSIHKNTDVFKDPETSIPERWLESSAEMQRNMMPFSLGPRNCIARNLAITELNVATHQLALSGVLKGAKTCHDEINIVEWFNSKYREGDVELQWPKC